jgi:Ser/Thr protein kinase RdoA (MazF antagonist)
MKNFNEMNLEEQSISMTKMAVKAMDAYGLGETKIQLIKHEMNSVFKVYGEETDKTYVLRIHPGNWLSPEIINTESIFLEALAREEGLLASTPVRGKNYSYVQIVSTDEVPEARCCMLFNWVEGDIYEDKLEPEFLIQSGEYLGRLHEYGKKFKPMDGFKRPRLDMEGLFGPNGMFSSKYGELLIEKEDKEFLAKVEDKLRSQLDQIGTGEEMFGFIHGDYYFKNLVDQDGRIGAIDFDLCGWGYYYYDLLPPYWPSQQGDLDQALNYILQGYRKVRKVPDGFDEYKDTFNAIRRLMDIYFFAARQDHPVFRDGFNDVMRCCIENLQVYMKGCD